MLYGRRLDQSLSHVDGSRYALVHAVAKRARQITLWLTADPAELRAESAPPPAPGELVTRDPVALAEAEILDGEVRVRWDPEGLGDDGVVGLAEVVEADPLLLETIEEDEAESGTAGEELTPALAQVLEGADDAEVEETPVASVAAVADADGDLESGGIEVVSLDDDSDADDEDDED